MTQIKICGIKRDEDVDYINELKPDYCGFIVNFPKSHRSLDIDELKSLAQAVDGGIKRVGVFVNNDINSISSLLNEDIIHIAQLHGSEDESYINNLRNLTSKPIIKAFTIKSQDDVLNATRSSADYILLDKGQGSGETFDWSLISSIDRPWFLAGGLGPDNLEEAIKTIRPYAVDLSSSVETNKVKDKDKISKVIDIVRRTEYV